MGGSLTERAPPQRPRSLLVPAKRHVMARPAGPTASPQSDHTRTAEVGGPAFGQTAQAGRRPQPAAARPDGCDTRPDGCGTRPDGCDTRPDGCDTRPDGCVSRPQLDRRPQLTSWVGPTGADTDTEAGWPPVNCPPAASPRSPDPTQQHECSCRLHRHELEAADWLDDNAGRLDAGALLRVFTGLPHVREMTAAQHSRCVANSETMLRHAFSMVQRTRLPLPLPADRTECRCADLGALAVQALLLSGSMREGLDVRMVTCGEWSDLDVMLQLGPVTVTIVDEVSAAEVEAEVEGTATEVEAVVEGTATEVEVVAEGTATEVGTVVEGTTAEGTTAEGTTAGATATEVGVCADIRPSAAAGTSSPPPLSITAEPTDQPGYLLLRHALRADCRHARRLVFSGERVRRLMDSFGAGVSRGRRGRTGPAVTGRLKSLDVHAVGIAVDVVGCVSLARWRSGEFAGRRRPSGQPSAALVRRLCARAALLVPVGFPGSATESLEWRLSFSRHEYTVLRTMSPAQRRCLLTLKYCRTVLGGAAGAVKSYYLKTALMWLCETADDALWTPEDVRPALLQLLQYLEAAARRGVLPCYFLSDINVLASRSAGELARMSAGLALMRARLLSPLLALVADWTGAGVAEAAELCTLDREPPDAPQPAAGPPQPLVCHDFDTILASLFVTGGPADGRPLSMPMWSLLTLLFHVIQHAWMGPGLAADAERQQRERRRSASGRSQRNSGSSGSPVSPASSYCDTTPGHSRTADIIPSPNSCNSPLPPDSVAVDPSRPHGSLPFPGTSGPPDLSPASLSLPPNVSHPLGSCISSGSSLPADSPPLSSPPGTSSPIFTPSPQQLSSPVQVSSHPSPTWRVGEPSPSDSSAGSPRTHGWPRSPCSPEPTCGWAEARLLISQHRGAAAGLTYADSWLDD